MMSNDYLLVRIYYQNEFYDEFRFSMDEIDKARTYRDSWRSKENFTASLLKVTHEVIED
jgi:hypothetical protein